MTDGNGAAPAEPLLVAEGVGHRYAGRRAVRALEPVDLRLAPGELLVVRGPSGSGKSTLLLALGGLLRPSEGRVEFAGRVIAGEGSARRRTRPLGIGFVFQTMHLLPYLSALDNVRAGERGGEGSAGPGPATAHSHSVPAASGTFDPRAELAAIGLGDRLGHRPRALSVGERQRVALMRALAGRPRLVLADEPTGNLDPASAELVLRRLDAYRRGGGAVVLATHEREVGVEVSGELALG